MDPALDGVWIIDTDGTTVYANQRMCEILGIDRAEVATKHALTYVFPEDRKLAQGLFRVKDHSTTGPFHLRLLRVDGTTVRVVVHLTPIHDMRGRLARIVGTFEVAG